MTESLENAEDGLPQYDIETDKKQSWYVPEWLFVIGV